MSSDGASIGKKVSLLYVAVVGLIILVIGAVAGFITSMLCDIPLALTLISQHQHPLE